MNTVVVEQHREQLELELARHASRPVRLLAVPDIAARAAENGVRIRGNPVGISLAEQQGSGWLILMRSELSETALGGVLGRLDVQGYWTETSEFRKEPSKFLRHLVLHELAHLENNWDQSHEDECDEWAFARISV